MLPTYVLIYASYEISTANAEFGMLLQILIQIYGIICVIFLIVPNVCIVDFFSCIVHRVRVEGNG